MRVRDGPIGCRMGAERELEQTLGRGLEVGGSGAEKEAGQRLKCGLRKRSIGAQIGRLWVG